MFVRQESTEVELTTAEQLLLDQWLMNILDRYAAAAAEVNRRPIDVWWDFEVSLGDWPIPAPGWATDVEFASMGAEIHVTFTGVEHRFGDASAAWVTQVFFVNFAADRDIPAGTLTSDGPLIAHAMSDDLLTIDAAGAFAGALQAAVRELIQHA